MTHLRPSAYDPLMLYEIVVDAGETPNKCTITPLAFRADFRLFPVRGEGALGPLSAPLLLHHEGECLSRLATSRGVVTALASVDCVWRRLPKIIGRISWQNDRAPVLAKIPAGFKTVYPRVGRPEIDPGNGLATIEAIFVAAALLGCWDPSLLSKYYFGRQFIEANRTRFLELGMVSALGENELPRVAPKVRDSLSRRRNRGRGPK